MPLTANIKKKTYADYLQTPEGASWQLLNGVLQKSPAPYFTHQTILKSIFLKVNSFVEASNLGTLAFAPVDVYFDNENCVQPDIFFISKAREHIITEKNIQGAPDLAVEIVSRGNAKTDTVDKKELYARFGVKEYWIVYPTQKMVEVYALNNTEYNFIAGYKDVLIAHNVLKGLQIELKNIFNK